MIDTYPYKNKLHELINRITEPTRIKDQYICPICGSGTGKKRTGAFTFYEDKGDGQHWHCYSCGNGGDIFQLIGLIYNLNNFIDKVKKLDEILHMETITTKRVTKQFQAKEQEKPEPDYTEFIKKAHESIDNTDYWKNRGLSRELIDRYNIGYVDNWTYPDQIGRQGGTPRLIIPTSKHSFLARYTGKEPIDKAKQKVGRIHLFNIEALRESKEPIFIVEGEIDALSIIEAGGQAIGLGGVNNIGKLLTELDRLPNHQPIIISLDNDEVGANISRDFEKQLQNKKIDFIRYNISGAYKDPNEALNKEGKNKMMLNIKQATEEAKKQATGEENTDKINYLMKTRAVAMIDNLHSRIESNKEKKAIDTGFKKLNTALNDGLHEGLYIIGAMSSLGKSTFCLQVADHIASTGQDVLIFTLEMSKYELMAKSISKLTNDVKNASGMSGLKNTYSTWEILGGKYLDDTDEVKKKIIDKAFQKYGFIANHVYFYEGEEDISQRFGVEEIASTIQKHINFTGNLPVVIVDYLQILAPPSDCEDATDKRIIDTSILKLKQISRKNQIPIIGISSFNRASYNQGAGMESFKESGTIEYSADVLLSLNYDIPENIDKDKVKKLKEYIETQKSQDSRKVVISILKNRNGLAGKQIQFNYYPKVNYFEEQ